MPAEPGELRMLSVVEKHGETGQELKQLLALPAAAATAAPELSLEKWKQFYGAAGDGDAR